MMKKRFFYLFAFIASTPTWAGLTTTDEVHLSAHIDRDPPQVIYDGPSPFNMKLNGSIETIPMCLYDGSLDLSQSAPVKPSFIINIEDDNKTTDGERTDSRAYSINLGGNVKANGISRVDLWIQGVTPGGKDWGFLNRNFNKLLDGYSKWPTKHAKYGTIPTEFDCLKFDLKLYPIGQPGTGGTPAQPIGKKTGNYSGNFTITVAVSP
jgi:hypothetical protein